MKRSKPVKLASSSPPIWQESRFKYSKLVKPAKEKPIQDLKENWKNKQVSVMMIVTSYSPNDTQEECALRRPNRHL
jgi:hypothetical protein